MEAPEEVFQALNASNVLVAILETIKSIEVSTESFVKANEQQRELDVSYDDEKKVFIFKLRENNE